NARPVHCQLTRGASRQLCFAPVAAMAERERAMISARTKAALQAAKARGVKLGGPNINQVRKIALAKNTAIADQNARIVLPIIREVQRAGARSLQKLGPPAMAASDPV